MIVMRHAIEKYQMFILRNLNCEIDQSIAHFDTLMQ